MSNFKHSFWRYCVDPDAFAGVCRVRDFVKILKKQSNTPEAAKPYHDLGRFSHYDEDDMPAILAPRYFGAGGEALCEAWLETFGAIRNISGYQSQDTGYISKEDTGYDGFGRTLFSKNYKYKTSGLCKPCRPNDPVYLQIKTALNPMKEFSTNDGSRIMNFYGNANGMAKLDGKSATARFVLVTTGKGLHYKLNQNTQGEIEVINFKDLSKAADGNDIFWTLVHKRLGIPAPVFRVEPDPEFVVATEDMADPNVETEEI